MPSLTFSYFLGRCPEAVHAGLATASEPGYFQPGSRAIHSNPGVLWSIWIVKQTITPFSSFTGHFSLSSSGSLQSGSEDSKAQGSIFPSWFSMLPSPSCVVVMMSQLSLPPQQIDQTPTVCRLPLSLRHVPLTVMVSGCPCAKWIYKVHPAWGLRLTHMKWSRWDYC